MASVANKMAIFDVIPHENVMSSGTHTTISGVGFEFEINKSLNFLPAIGRGKGEDRGPGRHPVCLSVDVNERRTRIITQRGMSTFVPEVNFSHCAICATHSVSLNNCGSGRGFFADLFKLHGLQGVWRKY